MKTKTTFYFAIGFLFLGSFLLSCSPQVANGEDDPGGGSGEPYMYSEYWTAPSDTLPGYAVYPVTYDLWANSFRYWGGDSSLLLAIVVDTTDLLETNFRDHDGLKIYFGLESLAGEDGIPVLEPVLIMVADSLEWEIQDSDTILYINDVQSEKYWVLREPEGAAGSPWSLEFLETEEAQPMVEHWQTYIDTLTGFGPVYSYSFSNHEVNTAIASSKAMGLSSLTIRLGLHSVSPADPSFYFFNKDSVSQAAGYKLAGFLVPAIILTDTVEANSGILLNFSNPCPRWCGKTDLWAE